MHNDHLVRSEINVTPLVDVCLVLLIIFMVVTPMLVDGVAVALPETRSPEVMPESRAQLDITIDERGLVYLGETPVPPGELTATLRATFARQPEADLVISADRRLRYDPVRRLMRELGKAGWSGAGIETRRIPAEPEAANQPPGSRR